MQELQEDNFEEEDQNKKNKSKRRGEERIIQDVINKVQEWRKLYKGDSQLRAFSVELEVAAGDIQMSRKTLDDYQNQLRTGFLFQFDFNVHKDDKMGVLRQYNDFIKKVHRIYMENKGDDTELIKRLKELRKKDMQKILKKHSQDCCYISKLKKALEQY